MLARDYLIMLVLTVVLLAFAYGLSGTARITRIKGGLMFASWIAYMFSLYHVA